MSIVGIIIICILIFAIPKAVSESNKKRNKVNAISELFDFNGEEYFISVDGNSAIAINPHLRQICYVDEDNRSHIFAQDDIIEAIMLVDSKSVSSTTGVNVGPFLFAESVHHEKIKHIAMKIRVKDLKKKVPIICFLNAPSPASPNGFGGKQVKQAIENSEYWHDKLIVLAKSS